MPISSADALIGGACYGRRPLRPGLLQPAPIFKGQIKALDLQFLEMVNTNVKEDIPSFPTIYFVNHEDPEDHDRLRAS